MSYLVLARKSRPQDFDQVVGQQSVVKTLKNSLRRDRVAHAILFSGVRGVGKTTLARIMAKAINCESSDENIPCNECGSCKAITAGSAIDLYEIDGASNRGIQEIRELKEKIKFLPTSSKFKIIIIDEVHMLTTEAFNALLKTLEEPPKHVHFMFATTEIHKIPITILSRCQRYELQRIGTNDLFNHFKKLAEDEGVTIEDKALLQIIREADGSVRDGLSLLDQVFSYGEKEITVADVTEVLGLVNRDALLTLTRALLTGDHGITLTTLSEFFKVGMDIKRFSNDLLDCFRTLLLCKIKGCDELLNMSDFEKETFTKLAAEHSVETIHAKLNILMAGFEEIRHSSQPRLSLETSFFKVIEAGNIIGIPALIDKFDQYIEATPPVQIHPQLSQPAQEKQPEEKKTPEIEQPSLNPVPDVVETNLKEKPYIQKEVPPPPTEPESSAPPHIEEEMPEPEPQQQSASAPPSSHQKGVKQNWMEFIKYVKDRKLWMSQVLQRVDKFTETETELQLEYDDHFNCVQLKEADNHKALTEFVLDFFQKELKVRIITHEDDDDELTNGEESPHKLRQKLASDPLVIRTLETFNGQVGEIRIGPRSR